jgi:hypothetical protein
MAITPHQSQRFALALAPAAARLANYCDHVEHNEASDPDDVAGAADSIRRSVTDLARKAGVDIIHLYAARLEGIESANVLRRPGSFDGPLAVSEATTWRDLQVIQSDHDRTYHPDVLGLARLDQLRHCTFHVTKIVGAFAEPAPINELIARRLPDALLFSIKLSTVVGRRLPEEPLQAAHDQ